MDREPLKMPKTWSPLVGMSTQGGESTLTHTFKSHYLIPAAYKGSEGGEGKGYSPSTCGQNPEKYILFTPAESAAFIAALANPRLRGMKLRVLSAVAILATNWRTPQACAGEGTEVELDTAHRLQHPHRGTVRERLPVLSPMTVLLRTRERAPPPTTLSASITLASRDLWRAR